MYPYVVVMAPRFIGCGNTHRLDYALWMWWCVRVVHSIFATVWCFNFNILARNGFNPLGDWWWRGARKSKVKYLVLLTLNAFGEADNFAILQRETETETEQMQLHSGISQAINWLENERTFAPSFSWSLLDFSFDFFFAQSFLCAQKTSTCQRKMAIE